MFKSKAEKKCKILFGCIMLFFFSGCTGQPQDNVMSPGMKISVENGSFGKLSIICLDNNYRCYQWHEGQVIARLKPVREENSIGLSYYGKVKPIGWLKKAYVRVYRIYFDSNDAVTEWFNTLSSKQGIQDLYVWNNKGMVVGWQTYIPDVWFGTYKQLGVELWQIYVDGQKPDNLPGSQDDKIMVDYLSDEELSEFEKSVGKWW